MQEEANTETTKPTTTVDGRHPHHPASLEPTTNCNCFFVQTIAGDEGHKNSVWVYHTTLAHNHKLCVEGVPVVEARTVLLGSERSVSEDADLRFLEVNQTAITTAATTNTEQITMTAITHPSSGWSGIGGPSSDTMLCTHS